MANRYSDWLRQADADLAHARNSLESGSFEWSCFASHQAAEKGVKALFLRLGRDSSEHTPEYLPVGFPVGVDLSV